VVDEDTLEVSDEQVADDPKWELRLLVHECRSLGAIGPSANGRPELLQESEVAGELLPGRALRSRADDQPALGKVELLADRLQALALFVLEPPRDSDPVARGDENEEAARQ
jgi:hypothetical protein